MFSSYSVNISQKHSRSEGSALMWGTAWRFTSGLRAWKWYILGLSSLLLSHHNWSVRTLLSESSDKWSAAVMSESSKTLLPRIRITDQILSSTHSNLMHAFDHGSRNRNTDFEMHQTEAHLHQNIEFMSSLHSCRSRK